MAEIPVKLGINAYNRSYSGEPEIRLENRFLEKSGVNQIEQRIILARPGTTRLRIFGQGPVRALWTQSGAFTDSLLVVSGSEIFRYYTDGTVKTISGEIEGGSGDVSMDAVSDASTRRVFIADGTLLQYYDGGTHATGTLTATIPPFPDVYFQVLKIGSLHYAWGAPTKKARQTLTASANFVATETVRVGDHTYTFVASPTTADDVKVGATTADSLANLVAAINHDAGEGTLYGTGTVASEDATAEIDDDGDLVATAVYALEAGNFVETETTGANAAWGSTFMTGGGDIDKRAGSILHFDANPSSGDLVPIGNLTYEFNTSIAAGAHVKVLIGATLADSISNLCAAINLGPGQGTVYEQGDLIANIKITGTALTGTRMWARAIDPTTAGTNVATPATTGSSEWTSTTLLGAQDGTLGNPLLVALGHTDTESLANMATALNDGVTTATATVSENDTGFHVVGDTSTEDLTVGPDPNVSATSTSTSLTVTSRVDGGTSIATTVTPDPDDHLSWDNAHLVVPSGATKGRSVLTLTPSETLEADVIDIGGVYYGWGDIATADQDGTSGHPWLAPIGESIPLSLVNLATVINFSGIQGVDYSSSLGGANEQVTAAVTTDSDGVPGPILTVTARSEEADGNAITTTVFAGTVVAWGGATLSGGGVHALHGVEMPDGQSPIAVASCAGFLLVALANSQRFYWILPGATTIDPLNFASAEFSPDNLSDILAVADQVWLIGGSSIEVWYPTGGSDVTTAFQPVAGRAFANGAQPRTAVRIRDTVIFVGADGVVYSTGGNHMYYAQGGTMQRISTHAIEERIRTQLALEAS
jgi:hypothetical protein